MPFSQSSNISAASIGQYFNGTNNMSLGSLYRGSGTMINISQNNHIPLSGAYSFNKFQTSTYKLKSVSWSLTAGTDGLGTTGWWAGITGSSSGTSYSNGSGETFTVTSLYHFYSGGVGTLYLEGTGASLINSSLNVFSVIINGFGYSGSAGSGSGNRITWNNIGISPFTPGSIAGISNTWGG